MTVQLKRPFVWPEAPKDRGPWMGEFYDVKEKAEEANTQNHIDIADAKGLRQPQYQQSSPNGRLGMSLERMELRQQAKMLREGMVQGGWKGGRPLGPTFEREEAPMKGKSKGFRKARVEEDEGRAVEKEEGGGRRTTAKGGVGR